MSFRSFDIPDSLRREWDFGREGLRPVKICANINTTSFGDFVNRLFYVNTIAEQFDRSHISLIYKDDADYKKHMVRLLPQGANMIVVPSNEPLPSMELMNPTLTAMRPPGMESWFKAGLNVQDLFITEGMTNSFRLQAFERMGHLRFPEDSVAACTEELIRRGVKPDRWFCTLHAREPGYYLKPQAGNFRDCDPEVYFQAAMHIILELGGQVVRMGHPEMTRYPDIPDLVDLSAVPDSSFLQVFAMTRSRFLLCGASGPEVIGEALHLPVAITNSVNYAWSNDRAVVRTVDLITPDGKTINQRALAETGMDKNILMFAHKKGYRVLQNSAEEVCRVADFVYEMTHDTPGWRVPDPPNTSPRPNQLIWPGTIRPRATFLPMPGADRAVGP